MSKYTPCVNMHNSQTNWLPSAVLLYSLSSNVQQQLSGKEHLGGNQANNRPISTATIAPYWTTYLTCLATVGSFHVWEGIEHGGHRVLVI